MKALIAGRSPIARDRFLQMIGESLNAELLAPARDQRKGPECGIDPEVVILDARLPGAEEYELLMTIYNEKSLIIMIMLTPHADYQIAAPCHATGANFLMSPVDLRHEVIEAALQNPLLGSHS